MRSPQVIIPLCILVSAACAKHVPEPTPHPATPHITWSVSQGYGDNEVCRSTQASPCVLTLSEEAANRRIGVFHLFLHAAASDTRYIGTMTVGFMAGDPGSQRARGVDQLVPRGSPPVSSSSTGLVQPPGTYYVDIALTAKAPDGTGPSTPFKERIRVEIK